MVYFNKYNNEIKRMAKIFYVLLEASVFSCHVILTIGDVACMVKIYTIPNHTKTGEKKFLPQGIYY